MKILLVTSVDAWTRSVSTIHKWIDAGRALGHDIAVYGEANPELPRLKFTTDLSNTDLALFVVQVPSDFPDMPYLARVLDGIPRKRRAIVDLWAHYNETIRVDHDFNHLEKLDGHQAWEWQEAIAAVSDVILQPALAPKREGVKSFLFHGFDESSVEKKHKSASEVAAAWASKPYGAIYVGSNWMRWHQVRAILEGYESARAKAGRACLIGWDWGARPGWAIEKAIMGVDSDPAFLERAGVEIRNGVRFDEIVPLLGQAKFAPVIHRPLFNALGFVTNRSFETFYADTIPVLMLAPDFVEKIYGAAALKLIPSEGVAKFVTGALANPESYWDAVLKTRAHLAAKHSYAVRLDELKKVAAQ
ncbi:MAG: hypothetical protein KF807_10675 [Xanthobacteraceae bacterium]|nr:hypothetical protein [Xanthobacteraceae bacterium]